MKEKSERLKISVCVATYNQRNYIEDCLLSVLRQDCEADVEILVGDDCSSDGTTKIVQEISEAFPGRLTVISRERNIGGCKNYQDLIARASGDYIAHLDGDDYWMPGKLAAQIEFLQEHPECAAVYTNAIVVNEKAENVGVFNNYQPSCFDIRYLLSKGNFLNCSSLLYCTKLKQRILDIDREFVDYQIHLRLSCNNKLGYLNRCLVAYRTGTATSTVRNTPDKVREIYWEALCDPFLIGEADASRIQGMSYFFANLLYNSATRGRIVYTLDWATRIRRKTGKQAYQILARSLPICISIAANSLLIKLNVLVCESRQNVVNRR